MKKNIEIQPDHLRTYMVSLGVAINYSGLERQLGVPFRSVRDWVNTNRWISAESLLKLHAWASRYGYRVDVAWDNFI